MNSVLDKRMEAAEREYEISLQRLMGLLEDFTIENYWVDRTIHGLTYSGLINYKGRTLGYFQRPDAFHGTHVRLDDEDMKSRWESIKSEMGNISGEMMMDALLTKEGY